MVIGKKLANSSKQQKTPDYNIGTITIGGSVSTLQVDQELNANSTNAISNKAVAEVIEDLKTHTQAHIFVDSFTELPNIGEDDKIYINRKNNLIYRWDSQKVCYVKLGYWHVIDGGGATIDYTDYSSED